MNTRTITLLGILALSYTVDAGADAPTLIGMDFRPFKCLKSVHRSKVAKGIITVALHGSGNVVSIPEIIDTSTITVEGWIKPIRVRLVQFKDAGLDAARCALLGRPDDSVLLVDFRIKPLLGVYDYSPYSGEDVIAVLRLEASSPAPTPGDDIQRYAAFATFRITD